MQLGKFRDKFFSKKYVNQVAIENNIAQEILYRCAFFPSIVFANLGISANTITTLSLILSFSAFSGIVFLRSWPIFCVSWILALYLDYCDGTVARITKSTSIFAFRYDHISDIFKIGLVFVGIAIYYEDSFIWILCFCVTFFYQFSEILHHDLAHNAKLHNLIPSKLNDLNDSDLPHSNSSYTRIREKYFLVGVIMHHFPYSKKIFDTISSHANSIFMNFNGHTLLLFPFFALGKDYTIALLAYLLFLCIKHSIAAIKQLKVRLRL
jgi:hypothetical protein